MKSGFTVLRKLTMAAACLVFVVQSQGAGAQELDEAARKHHEAGHSYFNTADYDDALREFQRAYDLSKRPAILLNLASTYERLGRLEDAVSSLERFVAEDPQSEKRAETELRIEKLKERIADQPTEPDAGVEAAVEPVPVPSATATAAPTTTTAPPPPPPPEPNRMPAYITWGVGGAAAVGAVVTGILANSKYNDADSGCAQTAAGCSDDEVSPIKTMALVSTILTGVAVVGAGVGTVLYFTASPPTQEQATGWTPRLNAGVGAHGGGIDARWTF